MATPDVDVPRRATGAPATLAGGSIEAANRDGTRLLAHAPAATKLGALLPGRCQVCLAYAATAAKANELGPKRYAANSYCNICTRI